MEDKEREENNEFEKSENTESNNSDMKSSDVEDEKNIDNRSFLDKVEDGMDEVVANVQDFFYGERESFNHDIPATMPDPDNEIRHVNKVQTRKNFNKRYGKKIFKWLGIIFAVGICVSLGYLLIEKMLLA